MRHCGDVERRKPAETDVSVNAGNYSTGQQSKFITVRASAMSLWRESAGNANKARS